MKNLSMKNNKQEIYSAYNLASAELEQLKKQLKPKASLCDITKTINHNLKDEVLADNLQTFVALVASYLVYLYVSGEMINNKLTDALTRLEGLFPEPPSLFPITNNNYENR